MSKKADEIVERLQKALVINLHDETREAYRIIDEVLGKDRSEDGPNREADAPDVGVNTSSDPPTTPELPEWLGKLEQLLESLCIERQSFHITEREAELTLTYRLCDELLEALPSIEAALRGNAELRARHAEFVDAKRRLATARRQVDHWSRRIDTRGNGQELITEMRAWLETTK